jgi:nucleotide-binding universal stress UspA family protein
MPVALTVHRILYATDCSAEAAHGAPVAVALAGAFAARIDVRNVVSPNRADHPDEFHRLQEHFYNALDLVVPQSARKLCEPRTFCQRWESAIGDLETHRRSRNRSPDHGAQEKRTLRHAKSYFRSVPNHC